MADWHVLGRDSDPTPGNPATSSALALRLQGQVDLTDGNATRLRGLSSGSGDLQMEGDFAPKFRAVLAELPGELTKLSKAYGGCAAALSTFSTSLATAKSKTATALSAGRDAHERHQGAVREIQRVLPPERLPALTSGLSLDERVLDMATVGLDESIRAQVRAAGSRARFAAADGERARRLADEAARLRGDAEKTCVAGIRDALDDSGIKDKSWYEKTWNKVSAPFRSWDDFVKLCGTVAMIAGVVALFVSGPVGWALMAAALAAGAVVFADSLAKYARGEAGLGTLALDAAGLIPGGRGVLSVTKLGRAALGLTRQVAARQGVNVVGGALRGGTTALAGQGRRAATALPHALRVTEGIRGAVDDPRLFARAAKCRFVGRDPVDMASGEMILQQQDFTLPGLLTFTLERTHLSSYRVGRWFGPSWSSTLDQRLEVDEHGICFAGTDGVLLTYPHPAVGESVLPEEGPRLRLTRSAEGFVVSDDASGRSLHFPPAPPAPTALLPLAGVTDRNGHRVDLTYDDLGELLELRHSGGHVLDIETEFGRVTAVRLRTGGGVQDLVAYGYDDDGHLTSVVNSSGAPLLFAYDDDGRMTRWEDRNGTWYRYTYDTLGRCVRTSGSDGCLDGTVEYDESTRTTVETNSLGHRTTYVMNDRLQVERVVDALGGTTSTRWDRYDRPVSRTDPLGRTTSFDYDDTGDLVAVTWPDGGRTTATYGALRQPLTTTEPDGGEWNRDYDERGNLLSVTDPTGATTRYQVDQQGRLLSTTDALGHVHTVETDAAGLPVAVTTPLGHTTRYQRDGLGRVEAVTDATGATTRFTYTPEGWLTGRVLPTGAADRWRYDGEGNLVEHVDPLGQMTTYDVTHFDLPAGRTSPDGSSLAFSYDTELRLVTVVNPQGLMWRYDYDPAGRLVQETDFDGRVLRYERDTAGQLVGRVNGAGERVDFVRDALGNVVEQRSDEALTVFSYDAAGRVTRATTPDVDVAFERDPLGRVLAETCNGRTLRSRYDAVGRRTSRLTPSGALSLWDHDADGLPLSLDSSGHVTTFAHDAAGREVERRIGADVVLTQTWSPGSELLTQTVITGPPAPAAWASAREARLVHREYGHRADGFITAVDDATSGLRQYDLDPGGRITAVRGADWSERYAYDAAGNVTQAAWSAGISQDAQGEREYAGTMVRRAGGVRYEHDRQGRVVLRRQTRLSSKPRTWRYSWNSEDRLVAAVTPDGDRWRYLYDAFGRRVSKQRVDDDGAVLQRVEFVWDGLLLAEQEASGAEVLTWDWRPAGFQVLTQTARRGEGKSPEVRHGAIVTNEVGTPTELIEDGAATWRGDRTVTGVGTEGPLPLRFPGQYWDSELSLAYNFHRYYEAETGQYVSADPTGLGGGEVRSYVVNPTRASDPLGLAAYEATPRYFRGARRGEPPSFTPRPDEYKVDAVTGQVRPTHGLSVFDNPASVSTRGFDPHELNLASVPFELQLIQRGKDLGHFEITPRPGENLTPERYRELLERIETMG